jgi:hypothetical protein
MIKIKTFVIDNMYTATSNSYIDMEEILDIKVNQWLEKHSYVKIISTDMVYGISNHKGKFTREEIACMYYTIMYEEKYSSPK